jgi:predicted HicB family RNase H-like nuclease
LRHNLIIRGFDDQVHEKLGEIANQRGVSINSIVKDAVDVWLKQQQSEVPRKHHLEING